MHNYNLFNEPVVKPRGVDVNVFVPEVITKQLKQSVLPSGHKRIRLSSNFLPLLGFNPGVRTHVEALGVNEGIKISYDAQGATKVYQRTYTQRKNNPLEAQLDIQNQSIINYAIPDFSDKLHFTMQKGSIIIKPLYQSTLLIRNRIKNAANKLNSFVAMSAGVDCACLQAAGFAIQSLLEYRPKEKRDNQDLSETGALNAISNVSTKNLFNEDITKIDWKIVEQIIKADEQIALLHLSIPCTDHSNAKANSLKQKAIDSLDTTIDMVYDSLRLVETVKPCVVLIENVVPFSNSWAAELVRLKLQRWGYHLTEQVLDAREHNGLTSRKRFYLVASIWPGFEMPAQQPARTDLWNIVEKHLDNCRDVSQTSTLYKGIECGRSRIITKDSHFSPTVLKTQNRQTKDAIYIEKDGKYYFPSEELLKALNTIPGDFNMNSVSSTIASEIIGQSIDFNMHHALSMSIKDHILRNS